MTGIGVSGEGTPRGAGRCSRVRARAVVVVVAACGALVAGAAAPAGAVVPGINGPIVYQHLESSPGPQIDTVNPDGSGNVELTELGGSSPAWSPDSRMIAFTSDRQAGTQLDELFVMDAGGLRQ